MIKGKSVLLECLYRIHRLDELYRKKRVENPDQMLFDYDP